MPEKQFTLGQKIRMAADVGHLKAGDIATVRDLYSDGAYLLFNDKLMFVDKNVMEPLT